MNRPHSARLTATLATGLLCAGLLACSPGEEPETEPSSPPPTSTTPSPTATPEQTQTPEPEEDAEAEGTPVRIVVDEQTLDATLWDNPGAESLIDQLPLTLEFSDYGGQELTATPPEPITMDGMPDGDAPVAGDIGYYAPDGVLTLHYTDIGYWEGSSRLGEIDGDLSVIRGWTEPRSVTLELAE